MNTTDVFSITVTSISPAGNFVSVQQEWAGFKRGDQTKAFDRIIEKHLDLYDRATDQHDRTIFHGSAGDKLIVTKHYTEVATD